MQESKSCALPLGDAPKNCGFLVCFFITQQTVNGVDSETRTHGIQGHNLALYQLSHIHHMVRLAGVEPTTYALEGRCSILLRYRRISTRVRRSGASDGNRTHVTSLEGWRSTIELRSHIRKCYCSF